MNARIFNQAQMNAEDIYGVAGALTNGAVVIFPTDTVYGIGCSAACPQAIEQIYTIKQRPATQPLQILTASVEQAQKVGQFSASSLALARAFWPGALTLIVPPTEQGRPLTRGAKGIGIRVPSYALLVKILQNMNGPLCSTSANLHGQPVLTDETLLESTFGNKTAIIIKGGRLSPVASSVVDMTDNSHPRLLREGSISKFQLQQVLQRPFEGEQA